MQTLRTNPAETRMCWRLAVHVLLLRDARELCAEGGEHAVLRRPHIGLELPLHVPRACVERAAADLYELLRFLRV